MEGKYKLNLGKKEEEGVSTNGDYDHEKHMEDMKEYLGKAKEALKGGSQEEALKYINMLIGEEAEEAEEIGEEDKEMKFIDKIKSMMK